MYIDTENTHHSLDLVTIKHSRCVSRQVAQLVQQLPFKLKALGLSPSQAAHFFSTCDIHITDRRCFSDVNTSRALLHKMIAMKKYNNQSFILM